LTKLTEYHERVQYLKEHGKPGYIVRKKKTSRREKIRALRALGSINLEKEVGGELMKRLEEGVYGKDALEMYQRGKDRNEKKKNKRYVADFEESEECTTKKNPRKLKKKKKEAMTW
jgi:protein MAK16